MRIESIIDLDDPRITVYRSLKATNQTRGLEQFVVEGDKLVERLLASRFPVVSILATDRFEPRFQTDVPPETPVYIVPFERIHELVGFPFHRGVLGCGQRVAWPSCAELLRAAIEPVTLAVCPRLSNPENLGAIARIGDVFGINAVLAGPSCPDPLSRRVLRVSMGSALRLPVIVSDRLEELADELRSEHDVEFWAAVAEAGATPFQEVERPRRLGLVLGDEDQGVDVRWLRRCERAITIPMREPTASLNVAVAAGILLQSLTRHRDGGRGERP